MKNLLTNLVLILTSAILSLNIFIYSFISTIQDNQTYATLSTSFELQNDFDFLLKTELKKLSKEFTQDFFEGIESDSFLITIINAETVQTILNESIDNMSTKEIFKELINNNSENILSFINGKSEKLELYFPKESLTSEVQRSLDQNLTLQAGLLLFDIDINIADLFDNYLTENDLEFIDESFEAQLLIDKYDFQQISIEAVPTFYNHLKIFQVTSIVISFLLLIGCILSSKSRVGTLTRVLVYIASFSTLLILITSWIDLDLLDRISQIIPQVDPKITGLISKSIDEVVQKILINYKLKAIPIAVICFLLVSIYYIYKFANHKSAQKDALRNEIIQTSQDNYQSAN